MPACPVSTSSAADEQFTVIPLGDCALHPFLNLRTEVGPICRIDSSIHKAKAVRRTDDGITGYIENGPVVDFDEIQVAAETLPCPR